MQEDSRGFKRNGKSREVKGESQGSKRHDELRGSKRSQEDSRGI